jgi:hypothetical protein
VKSNDKKVSAAFASKKRDDLMINKRIASNPSPTEYIPDVISSKLKTKDPGTKHPFGIKTKRFGKDDNGVPGAGQY